MGAAAGLVEDDGGEAREGGLRFSLAVYFVRSSVAAKSNWAWEPCPALDMVWFAAL